MVRFLFILLFLGLCKFEIYAQYYSIQQITGTGSDYNYQTQLLGNQKYNLKL